MGLLQEIAGIAAPYVLATVAGTQVWMLKQIISCMQFRAKSGVLHNQHGRDDCQLSGAVERLEAKIETGFARIDTKLDAIDARCVAHMSRQNPIAQERQT